MILFFAHDTQASLPVNARQDKPNNSKLLCLTANPSTPSAVPKDFSSPSQHFLGHCLGTYLLFSLAQTSCPCVLWAIPSTGTRLQLCPAVLQHPAGEASQPARNHPFWNSFLHCLPPNHPPCRILSFQPCLLGVSSSAVSQLENYMWEPHTQGHNRLEFPHPQPVII